MTCVEFLVKRASKKDIKELQLEIEHFLYRSATSFIPVEHQTPEKMKDVRRLIREFSMPKGVDKKLSEDDVQAIKRKIRTSPFQLKKAFVDAAKNLPHPPGGRKRKFTDQQHLLIIDEISSLNRQGLELRESKQRVADKHLVSLSTIQRIWKARKTAEDLNDPRRDQ
jgi:hypothetical protein